MFKDYAFIKDGIVVNKVVFENLTEELLNIFIQEHELDEIILCDENSDIGGTYENGKFCKKQPYPSWIKNNETNEWEAPINMPEEKPNKYTWDEDSISWTLAPRPYKPFNSWIFNEDLYVWESPVEYPEIDEENPKQYVWNEDILNWEEI
jgi:hypothetical protein